MKKLIKIAVFIAISILLILFIRWIGIKGIIGFIFGCVMMGYVYAKKPYIFEAVLDLLADKEEKKDGDD